MAEVLKIESDSVVGKLLRVWIWADQNSVDGNGVTVSDAFIDRLTGRKGFARAMRVCGWLEGENGCLSFPGFERHNGSTAKERASTNRRVAKHRKCNGVSVTKTVTREEKRREEKNTPAECSPIPPEGVVEFSLGVNGIDPVSIVHAYPRREGDKEALEAVAASVRKGAKLETILAGTRAIAAVISSMPSGHLNGFLVSAAKFFRDERWRDDPATWQRHAAMKNGKQVGKLDLGGRRSVSL